MRAVSSSDRIFCSRAPNLGVLCTPGRPPPFVWSLASDVGQAVLRLFSIVDTKQKNPLFLFSFFVKPFSIVTQNKKWGQNFYVLGFWNIKRGHNLFQRRGETQNTKLFMGRRGEGWRAAVEGLNGKVIDLNEIFSKTYSFVYFEIFCIVEATYSENMKPMCRFNQLWNLEEAYFSASRFDR